MFKMLFTSCGNPVGVPVSEDDGNGDTMIGRLGENIYFWAYFSNGSNGITGLSSTITTNCSSYDNVPITLQTIVDHGNGWYSIEALAANLTVAGDYVCTFTTTDQTVISQRKSCIRTVVSNSWLTDIANSVWNALTIDHTTAGSMGVWLTSLVNSIWNAPVTAFTTIGSIGALIVSKLNLFLPMIMLYFNKNSYTMTIFQGDTYSTTESRSFEWSSAEWPDLTGATIQWITGILSKPVTATVYGSGILQTVRLTLTSADTAQFCVGNAKYRVVATLANTHTYTIVNPSVLNVE
jgi:hypothetical protein